MATTRTLKGTRKTGDDTGGTEGTGEAVGLSDPQELAMFPRREGHPWSPHEVQKAVRKLIEQDTDDQSETAKRQWRLGDSLLELYNGFPERSTGHDSFIGFITSVTELSRDAVYDALKVRRRLGSADDARDLGATKISLGFRLLDALGIDTFETLGDRDLQLPDGDTCRFPATVRQLRAALTMLKPEAAKPAGRRLVDEAARRNEALALEQAENPDLAEAKLRFIAENGDVWLRTSKLNRAQQRALGSFLRKLDRDA